MTENQTVPSPSGLPQLSNATSTSTPEQNGDSSGEIQCICDYNDDDGYTICCDVCETWQHFACMQVEEEAVPSQYQCSNCLPRPVDAKQARELQRQRRKNDRGPKANNNQNNNTKRKRSSTTSHKKKEPQTNGSNGSVSTKTSQSTEKTGGTRVPSPRESQAPTGSRKRAQRASQTHPRGNSPGDFPGVINSLGASCTTDRNGDIESDTDFEKYKYEFIDISGCTDKYANDDVKSFVVGALDSKNTRKIVENEDYLKRYTTETFTADLLPKTSVKPLPDLSKSYFEHSRWCYVVDSTCLKGQPVALFKGEIGFQDSYKKESINQYSIWNHPKPYVLFHPDLPIYIDARHSGTESRFVRRSCKPNMILGTFIVDDSNINFGFYATELLKPGTELTIGWDWNGSKHSQRLVDAKFDYTKLDSDEVKQLGLWIHNLLDKMGDCACAGGDECLLHRLRKDAKIDYFPPIKMPPTNGNSRKTKAKRQASSEPNGQKESTPDANDLHSRAGSVSTKVKSRSRDLTPSSLDTAVEPGTMTGREARKFKDVLSRIEKQQQEEHHPPPAKRRKRNSVVNNLSGNSATSPTSDNAKGLDGKNRRSSVFATISNVEISMVDAGTSRRTSDSSNSSSDRQKSSRNSKSPPGSSRSSVSSKASKATRKVVRKPSKAVYVDAAMQTEETDSELPWWRLPVQTIPPRPPRMTLRKKLLQSMQRDREAAANAATTAQDKKRKFDEITEVTSDSPSPPKVVKLPEEQSRRSISPTQPEALTPAVPVSCTDKMEIETINTVDSTIVKSTVPLTPHSPVGPSLTELFADSDRSRDTAAQEPKKQPSDLPQVNGTRPPGLHLQLPSSISVVNGPNTAMSLGTVTPSTATANSPPASSNASVFSPSVMCAMSSGGASSPIKTMKKLSLKDYGKRKHKAPDPVSDKKPDEISPESNISKPVVSLKDQSKIADILTPTEGTLAPQSQSSSMDPKIGVQRIANFGVR